METKQCSKCHGIYSLSCFQKEPKVKSGYMSQCRQCRRDQHKEWTKRPDVRKHLLEYKKNRYHTVPGEREKILQRERERRKTYPETYRRKELKRNYNISVEEYNLLLKKQNGVCAICNKECRVRKYLAVDHSHSNGKKRGLLCNKCNVGLGAFMDSPELLTNAIKYLEEHNDT